jgi:hypothetical protein
MLTVFQNITGVNWGRMEKKKSKFKAFLLKTFAIIFKKSPKLRFGF